MSRRSATTVAVPPAHDWRTTDAHEIERRRSRAEEERPAVTPDLSIPGRFTVRSRSGLSYQVEFRDAKGNHAACTCVDFRINGLGTCKHIEAVRQRLASHARGRLLARMPSDRTAFVVPAPDRTTLAVEGNREALPPSLREAFDADGRLQRISPEEILSSLRCQPRPSVVVGIETGAWLEQRRREADRRQLRRTYEAKVQSGEWPQQETLVPLFPYQREGMLHLAFGERALLADEMGLGKTIQAIAACALLHRLERAQRVLVVTPASLKTEWEEQIKRFTPLGYRIVFGARLPRLAAYARDAAPVFTIVNYEQIVSDSLDINRLLRPDIVVLDEAQRIKNWTTKTAQAVKRLKSRYAFVLTGTPIENRIDELYSLVDFLDPERLGPLFRFNREFYTFDEKGRPENYRNLGRLRERLGPLLLRRRKSDVETELPPRTDYIRMVPLSDLQRENYLDFERIVAGLVAMAKRRPLLPAEQDKLLRTLGMMRMTCDTNFILDESDRTCPKLAELEKIMEECHADPTVKVIVFSEWERMLQLVRETCTKVGLGVAWHTGSVPQARRRTEINRFKTDPACRVFLSTDSGGVGLNLQNASVVVNCDLPWTPAKLEQRIARAWRKHQTRPITVVNLVSENTVEHRMLATLADKRGLADSLLDGVGDPDQIRLRSGRTALLARLRQLVTEIQPTATPKPVPPADPAVAFAAKLADALGTRLLVCREMLAPTPAENLALLIVVDREAPQWRPRIEALVAETWTSLPGPIPKPIVLDRATHDAMESMIAAGLLKQTAVPGRQFAPSAAPVAPPLTTEESERARNHRATANRKLKAAQALLDAGLPDEAAAPTQESLLAAVRAFSVVARTEAPTDLASCFAPPRIHLLGPSADNLRSLLADGGIPDSRILAVLTALIQGLDRASSAAADTPH